VRGLRRRTAVLNRLTGRPDDRGAVAVLVAILMAGGVLLGFLALVIDVGQLYVERQQLQGGADSAALAVAAACARNQPECANDLAAKELAKHYADQNADDRHSKVAEVCGSVPNGQLPPCDPPATNLTACLGDPPTGDPYVEVRVLTEMGDGTFVLPPVFAQTMAGNEGYTGTSVGACARAGWQASVNILSITISKCEYEEQVVDSRDPEYTINFWDSNFDCRTSDRSDYHPPNAAGDSPDQFGDGQVALINSDTSCTRPIPNSGNIDGEFWIHKWFTVLPTVCETELRQLIAAHRQIYLPIYDKQTTADPDDLDASFHISAVVPFTVTGFQFGPGRHPEYGDHDEASRITGRVPCDDDFERCLSGTFDGPAIPYDPSVPTNEASAKLIG